MKSVKFCILLICLSVQCFNVSSQTVDPFTGKFFQLLPLMKVPSPFGTGALINANYVAGIEVNKNSEELGLGWELEAGGMIKRNISGIPDEWDGEVIADPTNYGFKSQGGVLSFQSNPTRDYLDFYRSTYKIDSPAFYFPDYDNYIVSGPGINGKLEPNLFDFATTELNFIQNESDPTSLVTPFVIDQTHNFSKSAIFNFIGEYNGDFKSRHYSGTPINGSTTLRYPGYNDYLTDSEYPLTTSNVPYVGIGNVGFDISTNRLTTSKYVLYTNNGFTITTEDGFVYAFTKPVYVNSVVQGCYPLNNDYSMKILTSSDTTRLSDSYGNYYIKDVNLTGDANHPYMVEWKQNASYISQWLLESITGPDYVDSNSNGVADPEDEGYWISYDWKLWSNDFTRRVPEYGFNYFFNPDENDISLDYAYNAIGKVSGKFGTFTKYNEEKYYLNKIQTSSHTAIFVRDIKLDDYSSQPYTYDNQTNPSTGNTYNMPSGTQTSSTRTSNYGTLYDDGGPSNPCFDNCNSITPIEPTGASEITIYFSLFDMAAGESVVVLNEFGTTLDTYTSSSYPTTPVTFPYGKIKIKQVTGGFSHGAGYRMGWSSYHPIVVPQLKLTRIVLLKNEDYTSLPAISNLSTAISSFDLSTVNRSNFFNETWYASNITSIESKSLQTVEFTQNYSLAKKYYSNIKTNVTGTDKLTNPSDVQKALTVSSSDLNSSGKLTLLEINKYGLGHVKSTPSMVFDYNTTVSADNPDYNPVKMDYWKFYKSDASIQGYSGYTTTTSKDFTDAWSLRKITLPIGGTIEIEYESNQYEKVLNGNGGYRGPSKMYSIKTATLPSSASLYAEEWNIAMEEITEPSEFTTLRTSPPTGTLKHIYIPFMSPASALDMKFINSGTFSFSSASYITGIDSLYLTEDASSLTGSFNLEADNSVPSSVGSNDLKYTGNGYIHFDLPVGSAVYGGGVRVKNLIVKNGATDTYIKNYSYSGGVTPMEADRFSEERKTIVNYSSQGDVHYKKLYSTDRDKHRMGPAIGYSSVIEKNLGKVNAENGSKIYSFITSDAGIENYDSNIEKRVLSADHPGNGFSVCNESGLTDINYIIEVIDKFSEFWGKLKEVKLADINGTVFSKTVNEYANTNEGAIVENYDFVSKVKHINSGLETSICSEFHHTICIKRRYPVRLSKQTIYNQGFSSSNEYITFDKITGVPTKTLTTTPNKGIRVERKIPAFRISQYAGMGPKSLLSTNSNVLSAFAYEKITVDSTISSSSDFLNYGVQTFKNDFNVRSFDVSTGKFINSTINDKYWIIDKSYVWAGANTSLDDYGLYKNSELPTTPFDYSLSSIDSKWRFNYENTLLDKKGHVLEMKGFNDRFVSKKYGYGDTLLIAEASNVNYSSFTFCGFESGVVDLDPGVGIVNYLEGELKMNGGVKVSSYGLFAPHTGNGMIKVSSSTTAPEYAIKYNSSAENSGLQKDRTYRASVWVHTSSPSDCKLSLLYTGLSTQTVLKSSGTTTIGDWILLNTEITVPSSAVNNDELKIMLEPGSSGHAYFDDLRLQPVEAVVTAKVYDSKTGRISATLDANNFATIYKYDTAGRLTEVWQELEGLGLKRVKKYQYNYARGLN